jgi:hypothetical protein
VDQPTRDLVARYNAIGGCLPGAARRGASAARALRANGYVLPGKWWRAVLLNSGRQFPPAGGARRDRPGEFALGGPPGGAAGGLARAARGAGGAVGAAAGGPEAGAAAAPGRVGDAGPCATGRRPCAVSGSRPP